MEKYATIFCTSCHKRMKPKEIFNYYNGEYDFKNPKPICTKCKEKLLIK